MNDLLDPTQLVKSFGYVGIFAIVFMESGIIFGFFLPGDSLLFAAGLLAANGNLNLAVVIILAVTGAILGNNAGYATGRKWGPGLFKHPDSFFFSKQRIAQAHEFFKKEGGKSLVLARFIPAARTLIPIIAGVGKMEWRRFFVFNSIGGFIWGVSLPILGYTLGKKVPNIDKYILPVIAIIIIVSAMPVLYHYLKNSNK